MEEINEEPLRFTVVSSDSAGERIIKIKLAGILRYDLLPYFEEKVILPLMVKMPATVILDLEKITYIDSSSLGKLLGLTRRIARKGGKLQMNLSKEVHKIVSDVGLKPVIHKHLRKDYNL